MISNVLVFVYLDERNSKFSLDELDKLMNMYINNFIFHGVFVKNIQDNTGYNFDNLTKEDKNE